jgi:hypothetical protein
MGTSRACSGEQDASQGNFVQRVLSPAAGKQGRRLSASAGRGTSGNADRRLKPGTRFY